MPRHHQWREKALKITHSIRTPDFYVAYGALHEAARSLELARTFKHHKEAVPRFEAAMKVALDRYLVAFESELKKVSFDPLLTEPPECIRAADGVGLAIEVRATPMATFANYWPSGPVDLPSLSKITRLSFWRDCLNMDIAELARPEDIGLCILERHLRIRASELFKIATEKAPRDAWRDAKQVLDDYPVETGTQRVKPSKATSIAGQIIRECFEKSNPGAGYKDHIIDVATNIGNKANELSRQLKSNLFGQIEDEENRAALFVREVR